MKRDRLAESVDDEAIRAIDRIVLGPHRGAPSGLYLVVAARSRARSSVNKRNERRRGNVRRELRTQATPPPIESERGFHVCFQVLAGFDDGGFGAEQLVQILALDVLAGHQAVGCARKALLRNIRVQEYGNRGTYTDESHRKGAVRRPRSRNSVTWKTC